MLLPNYDVFDEMRTYRSGDQPHELYEIAGISVGVSICEDAWSPDGQDVGSSVRLASKECTGRSIPDGRSSTGASGPSRSYKERCSESGTFPVPGLSCGCSRAIVSTTQAARRSRK